MVLPLLYLQTISRKSSPRLYSYDSSVWTQGSQKANNRRMPKLSMTAGYSHSYLAGRVYTSSCKGLQNYAMKGNMGVKHVGSGKSQAAHEGTYYLMTGCVKLMTCIRQVTDSRLY